MSRLLTVLLWLAASPCLAEPELKTTLADVERQIIELNDVMEDVLVKIVESEDDLELTQQEETVLRKKLVKQLNTFNTSLKDIVRIQRLPQKALMMVDGLKGVSQRQNVLEKGQKTLQHQIASDKKMLSELIDNLTHQQKTITELSDLQKTLEDKQAKFDELRQIQMQLLEPNAIEREALVYRAQQLEESLDLTGIFKQEPILKKRSTTSITYHNLPVEGSIISRYNEKDKMGIHTQGLTILSTPSSEVKAVQDGHIIFSNTFRDYGYLVILEHSDGYHTLYSGLNGSEKEIGDFIASGDTIGRLPAVEKPTLYLEVRKDGTAINPEKLLKTKNKS